MDRQTILISILSLTAGFLLALLVVNQNVAEAQVAVKDRDYQVVTARIQGLGDGLYIVDNRTGQMAVFSYDPQTRSIRPRVVRPVIDAFPMVR
jgi:hypothetical protein